MRPQEITFKEAWAFCKPIIFAPRKTELYPDPLAVLAYRRREAESVTNPKGERSS